MPDRPWLWLALALAAFATGFCLGILDTWPVTPFLEEPYPRAL